MNSSTKLIIGAFQYHNLLADGYHKRRQPLPEPPLLLEAHQTLVVPAKGGGDDGGDGRGDMCPNSQPPVRAWYEDPITLKPASYSQVGFLTQLGLLCAAARIRECSNKDCSETRKAMDRTAPACRWTAFRNWALVALSCREKLEQGMGGTLAHTHIVNAIHGCYSVLENTKDETTLFQPTHDGCPSPTQELFEVCNVIYWMANILAFRGLGVASLKRWDHHYIPKAVSLPVIEKASKKVPDLSLCKQRFWNFVNLAERKQSDLPDLVNALAPRRQLRHEGHDSCTASRCQYSHKDSTKVGQLHKCSGSNCEQRMYPVEGLVKALEIGTGTAWSRNSPVLAATDDTYIAISHVWSDGTGVGVKDQGTVNSCLFDYFARVAESLGCEGIWWDALSIPLKPEARSKALGQMHRNYANAEYTVVHDRYLLNIPFTDSATACLALVLSPWFTRCWTALELFMSKRVKVLFRGPDRNTPDIKDLDDDILAKHPGTVSRAHWLASSLISRIRHAAIECVDDILAILRPRSTSWMRDRTVVAALLAQVPWCDMSRSEGEITCDIITHLGAVPHSSLLHGKPTMRETGPFSWCAATLDDMPIDLCADLDERQARRERIIRVDEKGAVVGKWHVEVVTAKQIRNRMLEPHGEDVSVVVHFYNALLYWENCLVLRERAEDNTEAPALLVAAVQIDQADGIPLIDCRYVGAVRISGNDKAEGEEEQTADAEVSEQRRLACEAMVRIGAENGRPDVAARPILEKWLSAHPKPVVDGPEHASPGGKRFITHVKKAAKKSPLLNSRYLSPLKKAWYEGPGVRHYIPPLKDEDEAEAGDKEVNKAGGRGSKRDASEFGKTDDKLLLDAFTAGRNSAAVMSFLIRRDIGISTSVESRLGFAETTLLASQYLAHGRFTDARRACKAALQMLPDANGWKKLANLSSARALAKVCSDLGWFDEAVRVYETLVNNCTDESFEKHGIKFRAIGELTCLLLNQKHCVARAASWYQIGLQRFGHQLPPSVPALAYDNQHALGLRPRTPENEAKVERSEAERAYLSALRVFSRDAGKSDAITLLTAHNLAREWLHQGAISEGEELLQAVLNGYEQEVGVNHILALRAVLDLVQICLAQGREAKARELSAGLLQRCESNLGRNHWLTRQAALTAATLSRMRGRVDEAERLLRQAQEGPRPTEGGTSEYEVMKRAALELDTLRTKRTGRGGIRVDGTERIKNFGGAFQDQHPGLHAKSHSFSTMKEAHGIPHEFPRAWGAGLGRHGLNSFHQFDRLESQTLHGMNSSTVKTSYTRDGATVIEVKEVQTSSVAPAVSETRFHRVVKNTHSTTGSEWPDFSSFGTGF
ncbi:Kinesin light chain [Madurella mycetomatis]|uniref:Kinesin light chain n=1 Tax=Madurella mycetomatis TaxID=100816 RepID=A0A175W962_9PEZI|nr:Kinesin light chain [Madurella mycetomatis]